MKKLIFLNGAMGAGKSAVSHELMKLLAPCAFLDGDWCWTMNPFVANEENKNMVIENITVLLRSFLHNTSYKAVIFCWVMHEREIIDGILAALQDVSFDFSLYTITCGENELVKRLRKDIAADLRCEDVISRSLSRLPLYERMDTVKINTDKKSPAEAAAEIAGLIKTIGGKQ